MVRSLRPLILGLSLAALPVVDAGAAALGYLKPFSADQVQIAPNGEKAVMQKMYIGETAVRFEMQQGPKLVDIADLKANKGYRLFPDQKSYMEVPVPPHMMAQSSAKPGEAKTPCDGHPNVTCTKVGEEKLNGRDAEKWEFTFTPPKGDKVKSTHWIDKERKLPVKHEMPNGAEFEAKMVGTETVNGRKVEKWENTTKQKGRVEVATIWFDPELNVNVREEFPGGAGRELANIQVGAQADSLFQVPAGFKKVEPQPMPQQGMNPMQGMMPPR